MPQSPLDTKQTATGSSAGTSRDIAGPAKRRVAVLAVHGISDQKPFATAREITGLLLNTNHSKQPLYSSGTEHYFDLRVRGVQRGPDPMQAEPVPAPHDSEPHPFKRYVAAFGDWRRSNPKVPAPAFREPGHAFLHGQISGYEGENPHVPFETVRIETYRRTHVAPADTTDVHIYEAYWADLSRLGEGWLKVLGEFYQVLMHLASVGVHTLRAAATTRHDGLWNTEVRCAAAAAWSLAVPVALTNVILLLVAICIAVTGMLSTLDTGKQAGILAAVLGGGLLLLPAFGLFKRFQLRLYSVAALFALVVIAAIALLTRNVWPSLVAIANTSVIVIAAAYFYWRIIRRYDEHRPTAKVWGSWIGILTLGAAVISVLQAFPLPSLGYAIDDAAPVRLMRLLEVAYQANRIAWYVFYACLFASFAVALSCLSKRSEELRALYTGLLCISLPGLLFSLLTSAIWAMIGRVLLPNLPSELPNYVAWQAPVEAGVPVGDYASFLLSSSALLLPFFAMVFALFAILAVFGLLPAILSEKKAAKTPDDASRLGDWLTSGLTVLQIAGAVVILGIAVCLPLILALHLVLGPEIAFVTAGLRSLSELLNVKIGASLAGSALGVLALGRRFESLALKFGFLDPVLDVDNYLREHPRKTNPTARIFARYVSLLRYICKWTDAHGNKYDKLVIIAHSQGTVITVDLLRYLRTSRLGLGTYEPELDRLFAPETDEQHLPVCLFTMGSPLRQLYGPMFPHLYSYVYDTIDPAVPPGPSITPVGVSAWVNAFRAGDYVGRQLWRPSNSRGLWIPQPPPATWDVSTVPELSMERGVAEYPVGFGAHTHYWDTTAPAVATRLDWLLSEKFDSGQVGSSVKNKANELINQ